MSRIMPAFCSSVRPAAMLTVISGIVIAPFALAKNPILILRSGRRPRLEGWAPLWPWFETAQQPSLRRLVNLIVRLLTMTPISTSRYGARELFETRRRDQLH